MNRIHQHTEWRSGIIAVLAALLPLTSARAETLLCDFDNNFFFDGEYPSWFVVIGGATNWSIETADFGGAFYQFRADDGFSLTNKDVSGDGLVELQLTVTGTNTVGPQLLLEDGDGTRVRYSWYGRAPGSHVLTAELDSTNWDLGTATGSVAGLDLSNLVLFHIQVDDQVSGAAAYGVTLENLRTYPTPPPSCDTPISAFSNEGVNPYGGSTWEGNVTIQPERMVVTATGFGGGWQSITPIANAVGETMIELSLTVSNTTGSIGAIVVFEDGDLSQERWRWFGLTNGSYVLSQPLAAAEPADPPRPGLFPGLDISTLKFFHVQIDDGGSNHTYTVSFDNLRVFGFNPTIADTAFDSGASEFDLVWNSRPDRTYSVWYRSEVTGSLSLLSSNILSGGTSTTNTFVVPAGDTGFLQVSEECQ